MNTQTYRLVFNAARACMVAVAETARGCGKGGRAGGTRVGRRKQVWAKRCKQNRPVALVGWTYSAIHSGVFAQSTSNTSNDRLKGAVTLKAGYDAYKFATAGAADATKSAGDFTKSLGADGAKADPNSGSSFGISFSVGINSSKQDNSSATTQSRGTSIQANDIAVTATSGNITATGAKLQGENISLDAAKDINLMAAVC
ncbi:MAG: ESPR-type extended signal peptide-containing protein [Rhodoferax sp.]